MNLSTFIKDFWQMVKDYKWMILIIAVVTTVLSLGLIVFLNDVEKSANTEGESADSEPFTKVGTMDIYADSKYERFRIESQLPQPVIDEIHTWETFHSTFTLNTSNPAIQTGQAVQGMFEESLNPLQAFLGIDPTQHDNIKIDPDTGKAYATVEIDPENGDVRLVNVQEGFNDFRIQLDVNADDGTFAEEIPEDTDDLLYLKLGMTPGNPQLAYIGTTYDWKSGTSYPRMFGQTRNFYFTDPVTYIPTPIINTENGLSIRSLVVPGLVSLVIGLILGLAFSLVWAIFNKKIRYGFVYGWDVEDIYLKYDSTDDSKQITYDMLQSNLNNIAVISQYDLPEDLSNELERSVEKHAAVYPEISDIPLNTRVEEFALVIQRNQTTKEWYQRQRQHLKTYRQKSVKIVEI